MAQIIPYDNLGGLDLVSTDDEASPLRCRSGKNVQKRRSNSLARRQGGKVVSSNAGNNGGFGTFLYKRRDPATETVTVEKLMVGSKLFKLVDTAITITYSGTAQAVYEVVLDTTTRTWKFRLYEDSVLSLNQDLGVGFDEASPYTVTQLVAAIDALPNFAAVDSLPALTTSPPAAFLPAVAPTLIAGSAIIYYSIATEVNHPTSGPNPFSGTFSNRNEPEFENVSSIETDDIILFASKWDEQQKYDGDTCYRAGAPKASNPSLGATGAGTLPLGTYKYAALIVQVDAQGNRVEGIESDTVSITNAGATDNNVTLSNLLNTTGFNTDCALANGAQAGVTTITVDNGSGGAHTLKVGQTAYFFDSISGGYVERKILTRTNTTIGIGLPTVTIADNAVISNNLRILILRSLQGGSILYENVEIPNNSFTATQVYRDGKADASLVTAFTSPGLLGLEHGLPPRCGYIGMYRGRPVLAGSLSNPDTWYWASADSAENYPAIYSDFIRGQSNNPVSGVSSGERYFWLHKKDESFLVTGDLLTGQYNVSVKGDLVGSVAHATIARTDTLLIWLGDGAFFASVDGAPPERISDDIAPLLINEGLPAERMLQFKRAVAFYDRRNQIYVCFIPCETTTGGNVAPNSYSKLFMFDLRRNEWWDWTGLNLAGGVAINEASMIWTERRYSTFSSTMSYLVWSRLNSNTPYDYVDHNVDIEWGYESAGWHHLGQRSVNKKFTHFVARATDPEKIANYTLTAKFEQDFIAGTYQSQLSIPIGVGGSSSGWGLAPWGFFPWGNPTTGLVKPRRLKHGFAAALRPKFSAQGIYSEMLLSGYELEIEAPFKIDVKKTREG